MLFTPEDYKNADDACPYNRGPESDERWMMFYLLVKELRKQNELLEAIIKRLDGDSDRIRKFTGRRS